MTVPDLSVVIVSTNEAHFLGPCLNALAAEREHLGLEVWVVDNASTDSTAKLVSDHEVGARLLRRAERGGFATNNNAGLRQCTGRYVLVLNPDTVVKPQALQRMVAYMDTYPKVGICGAQLLFPDGSIQPSCRRFPTLASVVARRTPLRSFLRTSQQNARHLMADFDHGQTSSVDWLLGACLLARRTFLSDVGLLDAGYFLYAEDIDWCYRAWQSGWQVTYFAEARIVHYHQAKSDRALLSRHSWIHLKSMWRYYRKHLAPGWLRLAVQEERLS